MRLTAIYALAQTVHSRPGCLSSMLVQFKCHQQIMAPPLVRCPGEQDALDSVEDMREHDVPQHWRWAIDNDVRAGYWYTVTAQARRGAG